jgi:hypothetical protein
VSHASPPCPQGRFFEGHFTQLLKSGEAASIAALPPDLLARLLSSDGLNIGSELEVARAALLWAAADPAQRGPLLGELLPAARMPPGQLQEEAARGGLLAAAASGSSGSLLIQQQHHQQPQPQPQAKQPKYHHPQQPQQPCSSKPSRGCTAANWEPPLSTPASSCRTTRRQQRQC